IAAAEALAAKKIPARVIDLYSVKPVDVKTLREAARVTKGRFVIVEDHYPQGGLASAVLEAFAAEGAPRVAHLAVRDLPESGKPRWLDNIRRQLIPSGELARLRDEGLTGVTSNPTIFEKAVSGSTDYDEAMVQLVREKKKPADMLWELMVEDVQAAADVFRPVYDRTKGKDGFVSIEVGPAIANSTRQTIKFAEYLHDRCARPNVMVKIPATKEGLPAIEDQISKGNNINITLIFAVDRYDEVVEAYLSGLEKLHKDGGDVSKVASV